MRRGREAIVSDTLEKQVGRELRAVWWLPVLRGLVFLGLGLLMLLHPLETLTAITWVIGIFALVDGALIVLQALIEHRKGAMWWQLLGGLVVIGLGGVVGTWPKPTVLVLFYAVTGGVGGSGAGGPLQMRGDYSWYGALAIGLVNLVIGLLLAFNPQTSLSVVMVLFGVFALVGGVLLLISGFAARSLGRELSA